MRTVALFHLLLSQLVITVVRADEKLETASAMTLTVGSASDLDVRMTVGATKDGAPPPPPFLDAADTVDADVGGGGDSSSSNDTTVVEDLPLFVVNECGRVKGCLFKPHLCTPHVNCTYALSYRSDAKRVYLEVLGTVKAPVNSFVAVGFSADMIMGNDSVSECSSFNGEPFSGRLSYNLGKSNQKVPIPVTTQNQILTTHFAKYADGVLYCRLSQLLNPQENASPQENVQIHYVRPLGVHHHVFMASGLTSDTSLKIHSLAQGSDLYPLYTYDKVGLTHYQHDTVDFSNMAPLPADAVATRILRHESSMEANESPELRGEAAVNPSLARQISDEARARLLSDETAASIVVRVAADGVNADALDDEEELQRVSRLIKTHAVVMIVAWLVVATCAMFTARFLRSQWRGKKILGVNVWFFTHRSLNSVACALILVAIYCTFSANQWIWKGPRSRHTHERNVSWESLHAMCGAVGVALALFQPLNAAMRCHPGASQRPVFNRVHATLGYAAWIAAAVAMQIAISHFREFSAVHELYTTLLVLIAITFLGLDALRIRANRLIERRHQLHRRHVEATLNAGADVDAIFGVVQTRIDGGNAQLPHEHAGTAAGAPRPSIPFRMIDDAPRPSLSIARAAWRSKTANSLESYPSSLTASDEVNIDPLQMAVFIVAISIIVGIALFICASIIYTD